LEKGIHDDAAKLKEKGKTRSEIPSLITKDQESHPKHPQYKAKYKKQYLDDSMFEERI